MSDGNGALLKKSPKLIESSKRKRPVPPDKLKRMRHVFNTIGSSQSSEHERRIYRNRWLILVPAERLVDAFVALDHDPRKDIRYVDFLAEHELSDAPSGLLDFEHFALLVLEYEDKLRLEDEAIRRLDLKIAFECFDINKGELHRAYCSTWMPTVVSFRWYDRCRRVVCDYERLRFADH